MDKSKNNTPKDKLPKELESRILLVENKDTKLVKPDWKKILKKVN